MIGGVRLEFLRRYREFVVQDNQIFPSFHVVFLYCMILEGYRRPFSSEPHRFE